jgi:hypothetical protein
MVWTASAVAGLWFSDMARDMHVPEEKINNFLTDL